MAEVGLQLPDALIEDCVRGEIVKGLSGHPDLVRSVIEAVLYAKDTDRYGDRGKKTVLQKTFENMVTETAKQVFGDWIEENRELIRTALVTHLTKNKQRALKDIAAGIVEGISHYNVRVNFNLDNGT